MATKEEEDAAARSSKYVKLYDATTFHEAFGSESKSRPKASESGSSRDAGKRPSILQVSRI